MPKAIRFVWGPGGVGKSHFSIRLAYEDSEDVKLVTLDPSPRLFDLLDLEHTTELQTKQIRNRSFRLRQTDADKLFERLHRITPAGENIRAYYTELVRGLHRFRDYLCLLDIADEIQDDDDSVLIIDTPPLTEARGLTESISHLHQFFRSPLFQMSLGSNLLKAGVSKAMDFAKSFLGKGGVDQALEFVNWLSNNISAFQKSTEFLEGVLEDKNTAHTLIVSADISRHQIESAREFFKKLPQLDIIVNRSVQHLPDAPQQFSRLADELNLKRQRETAIIEELRKIFPHAKLKLFPLRLMGEDTQEELIEFLDTPYRLA